MSVIYGLGNVTPEMRGGAIAVGVFDGVHWGHRAIFQRLTEIASGSGIPTLALTFDKHPTELLAPARAPQYVCTLDQRIELIQGAGIEHVVVADFNPELAGLTHQEFLHRILHETLGARSIVVGSNFQFGRGRTGDIRYLSTAAPALGIEVMVVPSVIIDGGPVSSTRVRALIGRGDVADAANLLGRKFALRGTVVAGNQIGRTIGFPTANIRTAPRQLIPARGVYAVEAVVGGVTYGGVCNIGSRPTFGFSDVTVEVHLLGFQGNIYGETLDVVFCRKLRDEMVFESPEKLAEQIRSDLDRAGGCS